jgi:hypothetical protein
MISGTTLVRPIMPGLGRAWSPREVIYPLVLIGNTDIRGAESFGETSPCLQSFTFRFTAAKTFLVLEALFL